MAAILPAGDAVYTYTYLIELNKIFYEYELKQRKKKPAPENITKPRSRAEVKALLHQQTTVLDKTLFLLDDTDNYLGTSESELEILDSRANEIRSILARYDLAGKSTDRENLDLEFSGQISRVINILKESIYLTFL